MTTEYNAKLVGSINGFPIIPSVPRYDEQNFGSNRRTNETGVETYLVQGLQLGLFLFNQGIFYITPNKTIEFQQPANAQEIREGTADYAIYDSEDGPNIVRIGLNGETVIENQEGTRTLTFSDEKKANRFAKALTTGRSSRRFFEGLDTDVASINEMKAETVQSQSQPCNPYEDPTCQSMELDDIEKLALIEEALMNTITRTEGSGWTRDSKGRKVWKERMQKGVF